MHKPDTTTIPVRQELLPLDDVDALERDAERLGRNRRRRLARPATPATSSTRTSTSTSRATRSEPTREQFEAYRAMFAHFNAVLFAGSLPEVVLNFSRHARSYGFFAWDRWKHQDGATTHEISLNPDMLERDPRDVASTLVHEMVHLWQQVHGTPPRSGYHDREWAAKMDEVGLVPSSTGAPGGKRLGQHMSHYIAEDGPFARAFAAMPSELTFPWRSSLGPARPARPKGKPDANGGSDGEGSEPMPATRKRDLSKLRYTCTCGNNVWGKLGLRILCQDCEDPFVCELEG